jgi:hypothetical protein
VVAAQDVDWRDPVHWKCNDNVHPSRHGTYEGISLNPFETVFVKSTWHVAEPYTRLYAGWMRRHRLGKPGTEGMTNQLLYKFAIRYQFRVRLIVFQIPKSLLAGCLYWPAPYKHLLSCEVSMLRVLTSSLKATI